MCSCLTGNVTVQAWSMLVYEKESYTGGQQSATIMYASGDITISCADVHAGMMENGARLINDNCILRPFG